MKSVDCGESVGVQGGPFREDFVQRPQGMWAWTVNNRGLCTENGAVYARGEDRDRQGFGRTLVFIRARKRWNDFPEGND